MGATNRRISIVLATAMVACVATVEVVHAIATVPPAEPAPSGRRTAARALRRTTSTEWPIDVSVRLRLLEEHAERAARERDTTRPAETAR